MIESEPSPAKLELIRKFLRLSGKQAEIDRGGFLDALGAPGSVLSAGLAAAKPHILYSEFFSAPVEALRRAYGPHRAVWQAEYEQHVNWEFAEDELCEIVAFLEGAAGQHFLEARWRMDAYVGTNTEDIVEQIVADARHSLGLT